MKFLSNLSPKRRKRENAFQAHIKQYQDPEQIFQADDRDHHLSQLQPPPLAHNDPKGGNFLPLHVSSNQCAVCQERFTRKAWIQDEKLFWSYISRTVNQPCGHWAVCNKPDCLEKYYGIRAVYLTENHISVLEQRNGGKHIFCQNCGDRVSKWDYGFAYEDEETRGRTEIIMWTPEGIVKEEKIKEKTDGKTKLKKAMGCLGCVVCAPCILAKECAEAVLISVCFWYGIWKECG